MLLSKGASVPSEAREEAGRTALAVSLHRRILVLARVKAGGDEDKRSFGHRVRAHDEFACGIEQRVAVYRIDARGEVGIVGVVLLQQSVACDDTRRTRWTLSVHWS